MLKQLNNWPWLTLQIIAANVAIILALAILWYLAFTQQSTVYSDRLMATFNIEPGLLHDMYVEDVEQRLWASVGLGLFAALFASIGLAFLIARPLRTLARATERLRQGDYSVRAQVTKGEVGRLASNFDALAVTLEQEDRRRAQYMSDLGHELRTPITSLQGYIEGLEDGVFQADQSFFKLVCGELKQLTALTHTIESMQIAVSDDPQCAHLESSALKDVVQDAKMRWQARFQRRGLHLDALVTPGIEARTCNVSDNVLRQIFDNLLSNMFRYAPKNSACMIRVGRKSQTKSVHFEFINDAPEVSEDELPFLFDRFFRLSDSRTRVADDHSSGLGLSIVKQLCISHGGNALASLINQKLVITADLPLAMPQT